METEKQKLRTPTEYEAWIDDNYASRLKVLVSELRSTCDLLETIAEREQVTRAVRLSRDLREDEIKQLAQVLTDIRIRIGAS